MEGRDDGGIWEAELIFGRTRAPYFCSYLSFPPAQWLIEVITNCPYFSMEMSLLSLTCDPFTRVSFKGFIFCTAFLSQFYCIYRWNLRYLELCFSVTGL